MKSIPIALALFTSSRGHFDVKERYIETLNALNAQIPLDQFAALFANIKVSPGEEQIGVIMETILRANGFIGSIATQAWAHGQESHQSGYIDDIACLYDRPYFAPHQYCLHLEDDFHLHAYDGDLLRQFATAIDILQNNADIVQVRFPRFANERERILGLRAKHGIDGRVQDVDQRYFRTNDFSFNPSVFRTRDIRLASDFFKRGGHGLPNHVEHGLGQVMKSFSRSPVPLAVLNPANVKAAHFGTHPGEEDSVTEPVYAN